MPMKKICEICFSEFEVSRGNQKYCSECGENPDKARVRYAKAESRIASLLGERDAPKEMVCQECGKVFLSLWEKEYCSAECGKKHRVETAQCLRIGCFNRLKDHGNLTGRGYCSDKCREMAAVEKAEEKGDYILCSVCGKKFIRKNYSNVCCSNECRLALRTRRKEERQCQDEANKMKTAKYYAERLRGICPVCGKEFTRDMSAMGQKFCGAECRKNRAGGVIGGFQARRG
jgi:hypothetical protein